MDSSRRYTRRYTGSYTSTLDYTAAPSSLHIVRKYSSPSLTSTVGKSFLSSYSSSTFSRPSLHREDSSGLNSASDSGYWSSSSSTRASSETPKSSRRNGSLHQSSGSCKEDIADIMGRYLLPGSSRCTSYDQTEKHISRSGSLCNLSSSLLASVTSLSANSANFNSSSILQRRASRKRKELLASTRASSVERYSSGWMEEDKSSVEDGRESVSRCGSVSRCTPEPSGASYYGFGECKSRSDSLKNDCDDSSGLKSIQEGLDRVTKALEKHERYDSVTRPSEIDQKMVQYVPNTLRRSSISSGNDIKLANDSVLENDRRFSKTGGVAAPPPSSSTPSTSGRDYPRSSVSNSTSNGLLAQKSKTSNGDDAVLSVMLQRVMSPQSSGAGGPRRPWRKGRVLPSNSPQSGPSLLRLASITPACDPVMAAEARLAQRRAARAEAREMRLKELEKQQQQNPDNGEDVSDTSDGGGSGVAAVVQPASIRSRSGGVPPPPPPPPPPSHYSRRSSEDSNIDDTSKDVTEMQEKFREAMISNAQLDNEKTQLIYKVERLKDDRSDLTEQLNQLKKEHKKKCSDHEQLRKMFNKLTEENKMVRRVLEERDLLIQEYGLLVVGSNTDEGDEGEDDPEEEYACLMDREETEDGLVLPRQIPMKRVLLSQEASDILDRGAAKGSLEWRLRKVVEHKKEMEDELRRVNLQLEEHLSNQRHNNCLDSNIQREANKTVNEYKFKVQKAEAEVSSLQANVNRLEALVTRYKAQSEELEKSEEELKQEKRRLQRELRETQGQLEEMETSNSHLRKRFEKLKNARSNLLKDLSQDPVT